jgi:type III restriction enzyme
LCAVTVNQVIGPTLTIEVSATPAVVPDAEAIATGTAGFVSLSFDDVVEDELIKRCTVVNEAIGEYSDFLGTANEAVIEAAITKREELAALFAQEGSDINPLLLIQLPSESRDTTALDQSTLDAVERILADQHRITVENGKLAVWLTNRKDNLADITKNDSPVEVLIFKQAIAFGWDCPRSHVLVMFKDIRSPIFEIQTVGRIMRMPEVKHYASEALNQAYVYTNLDRVEVGADGTSKGYFKMHRAVQRDGYEPVTLPSVYLSRVDYGDLTLSFRGLFAEEADKEFGIKPKDAPAQAKEKADVTLELLPTELTRPVITDVVLENIDTLTKQEIFGNTVAFDVSSDDIKRAYTAFAKATSLPFAPVRSHTKIQQAFYDWFDKRIGYAGQSRIEIQRIVVCSESNQRIFKEIIERAKARFKEVRKRQIETTDRRKEYAWSMPVVDYYTDEYVPVPAKRAALVSATSPEATLLKEKRFQPEQQFQKLLELPGSQVKWWYKNGDRGETYFAVPYLDPETGLEASFYPDYIVRFTDGSVGIYDPKDGGTRRDQETYAKSDALQAYIRAHADLRLRGGIVWKTPSGWRIFTQPTYSLAEDQWGLLSF